MDHYDDTVILPKKSRQDRKQELKDVLDLPEGESLLKHLYRHHFPSPVGVGTPPGPVMIVRILSREFPD